jgi:small GTP-binding protein
VLPPPLQTKLDDARQLLAELRHALTRFGAAETDQRAIDASIRQLDEFFLLVVVGEFNAGKSAFINALVGDAVLKEGVTPTTAHLHVLTYGDRPGAIVGAEGERIITAPVELLRELQIVDTPGTNAILRQHEKLTTEFVPRADLVLFVTSADRPFTETERAFLESIRDWGKKVIIIVNKADLLQTEADLEQVTQFVRAGVQRLLGFEPEVFPVSARLALRAKRGEPGIWAGSRFDRLEHFIRDTLDEEARFHLKLANPLGVGIALARRYEAIAGQRITLLADDLRLLQAVDGQLEVYADDLNRGFDLRMTAVEKELGDMEARGHAYFEDTLRIGRVVDLLNRARIQQEFEERVVGDTSRQIERRVNELIDWLVDQDFRQWQAITALLSERRRGHHPEGTGAPEIGTFHADRDNLIASVGREAQRVVDTFDHRREAQAMADAARGAVTAAATAGTAALGLGTLVTLAASSAAADVTGILLASVVATLGFLIIPARRRRAKAEMKHKITQLRQSLAEALRGAFARAVEHSRQRMRGAIDPYSRFVRAEHARWSDTRMTLSRLRARSEALRDASQNLPAST